MSHAAARVLEVSACLRRAGDRCLRSATSQEHPHCANLDPMFSALTTCTPALSFNAVSLFCASLGDFLRDGRLTTLLLALQPDNVYICTVYDMRSRPGSADPSPRCFGPRARAYSSMRSSFRPAGTARCATTRPIDAATGLRFYRTAEAQGLVVGHAEGSGGQHE